MQLQMLLILHPKYLALEPVNSMCLWYTIRI